MSSLSLAKFSVPAIRATPIPSTRAIANSASSGKALPFSLHGIRTGVDECNDGKTLRMLMFGKPGAGKGTLSSRLVKKYDILTVSTGDLLRQHIGEGLVHHIPLFSMHRSQPHLLAGPKSVAKPEILLRKEGLSLTTSCSKLSPANLMHFATGFVQPSVCHCSDY